MKFDSNEIEEILPHKYPFLLVDRILDGEEGVWARGVKNISRNEEFFNGHFPGKHIMPGVLIVESLAQVGAIALLSKEENRGKLVYFAGIKSVKFKRPVVPGDVMELYCKLDRIVKNIGFGSCVAKVENEVCCTGKLIFSIQ